MLRVCCFLFNSRHLGVKLSKSEVTNGVWNMKGYCDSDWGNDKDTRRSVTGFVVFVNENPLSWASRSQKTVSLATSHAEYNAIADIGKEIIYMKHLMFFLDVSPALPIVIFCDNNGAIFLSNNHESKLSKHLDIKVHFIRKYIEDGIVQVLFIRSEDNIADSYTKSSNHQSYAKCEAYMVDMCSDD